MAGYLAGNHGSRSLSSLADGTLRTGDAGFLRDGQLYVLGRLGDSMKVRARAVFAEDLEAALGDAGLPPRRVGGGARRPAAGDRGGVLSSCGRSGPPPRPPCSAAAPRGPRWWSCSAAPGTIRGRPAASRSAASSGAVPRRRPARTDRRRYRRAGCHRDRRARCGARVNPVLAARRWLRCYQRTGERDLRLICFPHACGAATFYRPWAGLMSARVELLAVQYPGHEDRFGEACREDLHHLADEVAEVIAGQPGPPIVLFGHSLGAAVAYEVAGRLGAAGTDLRGVLVSGRPAPHVAAPPPAFDTDEALWAELARLGGTSDVLLGNERMRGVFTPVLRADFRMNFGYRGGDTRLACGVVAYRGAADDSAPAAAVQRWGDLTAGPFAQREFAGGHFYLSGQRAALVADISARLPALRRDRTAQLGGAL